MTSIRMATALGWIVVAAIEYTHSLNLNRNNFNLTLFYMTTMTGSTYGGSIVSTRTEILFAVATTIRTQEKCNAVSAYCSRTWVVCNKSRHTAWCPFQQCCNVVMLYNTMCFLQLKLKMERERNYEKNQNSHARLHARQSPGGNFDF